MPSDYHQGDVISLSFGFPERPAVGNFEIIRVLPVNERGQRQYRVRGDDGLERAIEEHQIRANLTQRNPFGNLR
ncbi:hypothetical protein AB4Z10_09155 [Bosea sp. RAF48]|uniref:hypothetical protein n=1 Tax=Bosea sp. RAF48 TaxID=3237480 RepID=UPI003F907825